MSGRVNLRGKFLRCLGVILVPLFFLSCLPVAASGQEGQGMTTGGVLFNWAFGAVTGSGESRRMLPVKQDVELLGGDEIKMLVQLQKKCFVYVFHSTSSGQDVIKLLFPYSLQQFGTDYDVGQSYNVPQEGSWLKLDPQPGTELIHLVASDQRIQSLENLWSQYESAAQEHKPHIAKELLGEIRNLKKQHRNLASGAERPITIGGAVRGMTKAQSENPFDVSTLAFEISAPDFYAKTYAIDHK